MWYVKWNKAAAKYASVWRNSGLQDLGSRCRLHILLLLCASDHSPAACGNAIFPYSRIFLFTPHCLWEPQTKIIMREEKKRLSFPYNVCAQCSNTSVRPTKIIGLFLFECIFGMLVSTNQYHIISHWKSQKKAHSDFHCNHDGKGTHRQTDRHTNDCEN